MKTKYRAQIGAEEGPVIFKGALYVTIAALFLSVSVAIAARNDPASGDVVHAVGGVVTKIDSVAKTIGVRVPEGTERFFKYTSKTTAHASTNAAEGARTMFADAYMDGKECTYVVLHYTGEGADRTAVAVEDFGSDGLKFSQGTGTRVDKAARTVTIKSKDGTEETYHVARDATIDTEQGVVKDSELAAKDGEKVAVHYSEDACKKLVHLFRHI